MGNVSAVVPTFAHTITVDTKKRTKLLVIFGGRSGEHEVSVKSARSVIENVDRNKFEVIPLAIGKNGAWLTGPKAQKILDSGEKIDKGEGENKLIPYVTTQKEQLIIFPVLHGPYGEDGTIQGMFEMMNIPYVGSGVLGSALGMDKIIQKALFAQKNLPIVDYYWFLKKSWKTNKKKVMSEIEKHFGRYYPLFVKPANLGSSVGISKAHNQKELEKAINLAGSYDRKILVERGVKNAREIEVSILGNDEPKASVCGEILPANEFYDYDAKYINEDTKLLIPAKIDKKTQEKIQKIATAAFKTLDCCGFARVDFFLEKKSGKIWLNEINTIPGFTSVSMYPKLWEASGTSYKQLIEKLIALAQKRWAEKQ